MEGESKLVTQSTSVTLCKLKVFSHKYTCVNNKLQVYKNKWHKNKK